MTVHAALRTVTLESRRSGELARLLERRGLVAIEAPSLREVPLANQTDAFAFGDALRAGQCEVLVLLTGVGTRALLDALATQRPRDEVLAAIAGLTLCCRGPKPVAVLKELGLRPSVTAPEPNTWRELVAAMASMDLAGKQVWVQEYGRPSLDLAAALRARGAVLHSAAVYAWQLPEDLGPLERAIDQLCAGEAEVVAFTAGQQVEHLLLVAERRGKGAVLHDALRTRVAVASIGPVTSEVLREHGLLPDLEPEHSKMGHLAKIVAERGVEILARKRGE